MNTWPNHGGSHGAHPPYQQAEMSYHDGSVYSGPSQTHSSQYGPPPGHYSGHPPSQHFGGTHGNYAPHHHQHPHSYYPSRGHTHQYQHQRNPSPYQGMNNPGYPSYPPQSNPHPPHHQRPAAPPMYDHSTPYYSNQPYQPPPQTYHQPNAFFRPPQQVPSSRSSSVTPASHMSTITLDNFPSNLHFPRHTPAPLDSRTPSPDIPVPPQFLKTAVTNQTKLRNPTATKVSDESTYSNALRESMKLNVKEPKEEESDSSRDIQSSNNKSNEVNSAARKQASPQNVAEANPSNKPAVSVSDATLLLGLRTLSPAGTCTSQDTMTLELQTDSNTVATDNSAAETSDVLYRNPTASETPQALTRRLAIPKDYPRRLALDGDETQLNALHCYIRRCLLEIFVVAPKENVTEPSLTTNSSAGRVGLRCVFCAMARRGDPNGKNEAPMAVFYPRSISEIYRLVTSWQRCHLRKCRNLPPPIRAEWEAVREAEKCRGKTSYWVESAKAIGLVDCTSKAGGIRFCLPCSDSDDDDVQAAGTKETSPPSKID